MPASFCWNTTRLKGPDKPHRDDGNCRFPDHRCAAIDQVAAVAASSECSEGGMAWWLVVS